MRARLVKIVFLTMSPLIAHLPVASAQQKQEQPNAKKSPPQKAQQASLTGCIDEQNGQYVLIRDQDRAPIANLEADGFPTEGFARHVGHKVTVRGTASPNGADRPVFKVRTVETVSDSCGPQAD